MFRWNIYSCKICQIANGYVMSAFWMIQVSCKCVRCARKIDKNCVSQQTDKNCDLSFSSLLLLILFCLCLVSDESAFKPRRAGVRANGRPLFHCLLVDDSLTPIDGVSFGQSQRWLTKKTTLPLSLSFSTLRRKNNNRNLD